MLGLSHKAGLSVLKVEDCIIGDWQTRHMHVVHLVDKWLVKGLSAKDGKETEPVLGHYVENVLVKRITYYFSVASVGLTSVN